MNILRTSGPFLNANYPICGLIIGCLFATFSDLRHEKIPVGLGEILLSLALVYCIVFLVKSRERPHRAFAVKIFVFWAFSAVFLLLGFFRSGVEIYEAHNLVLHNTLALALAAVVSIVAAKIMSMAKSQSSLENCLNVSLLFYIFFNAAIFWFSLLFKIEVLWFGYGFRYSGLSTNPNQFAFSILVIPFVLVHSLLKQWSCEGYSTSNTVHIFALIMTILMGLESASLALEISWLFGFLLFLVFCMRDRSLFRSMMQIGLLVSFFVVFFNFLIVDPLLASEGSFQAFDFLFERDQSKVNWYVEKELSRLVLIKVGLIAFKEAWLFGYGPGVFSGFLQPFEGKEVHNTALDWMLMSGLSGGILLLWFSSDVFFRALFQRKTEILILCIVLFLFAGAHFILRQPLFWFLLSYMIVANQASDCAVNKLKLTN